MGRLFGTDGVRGIVGETLTPELALRLGRAIGAYFGKGSRVLIGRDVRAGGAMIKGAIISGLLAEGVKVYDAGMLPTPALQYNVRILGFDGGIMITASHNPPEYNGVKVIAPDGIEIPREDERVIEEYYFSSHASSLPWREHVEDPSLRSDVIENYVKGVVEMVDADVIRRAGLKAVIDCANSVGAITTPLVLSRLGVKSLTVNCNLDPHFPGREPEPTVESLSVTSKIVPLYKADFGLGHDGDADRAIIITDDGQVIWGDRSGTLLTEFAAEVWGELPKRTFTGVSSSMLVEEYLKPRGIEVIWTPVGSVVISRMIVKSGGAISGFEENGGYMHVPHQIVRDGAMKAALIAYMIASRKEPLSSMVSKLPRYYPIKTKIPMPRSQALCAVEAVKEAFSGYRQITIDGVKVVGDDFWVLVRPSGTEPVLRIMLEARSPENATVLLSKVKEVVAKCTGEGEGN